MTKDITKNKKSNTYEVAVWVKVLVSVEMCADSFESVSQDAEKLVTGDLVTSSGGIIDSEKIEIYSITKTD